jgi:hypothetical protein
MLPSPSLALLVRVIVAGALKRAPFAGFKRLTTGGSLTIMLTGFDVVVTPELSVTTAVRAYLPEGALLHVTRRRNE